MRTLSQFFQPEVYGIKQRGPAFGRSKHQTILQPADIGSEVLCDFGAARKFNQEVFVVRISGLKESDSSVTRHRKFFLHAAADVEDHTEADRNVLFVEVFDRLLDLVFPHFKVFRLEVGDDTASSSLEDCGVDEGQI